MKFDKIYTEYALKLKRYFLFLTHDNELSEDLVQETFYQAYRSISRYDGSCKMITWLYQIGKHCYYDYLKKSKHYKIDSIDELTHEPHTENTPEDAAITHDTAERLKHEAALLPEPNGEVLRLRLFEEMSYADIAEIFGKSEGWVRVVYYRAKKQLLERMESHGYFM